MKALTDPPEKAGVCERCLGWWQTLSVRFGMRPHRLLCRGCRAWTEAEESAR